MSSHFGGKYGRLARMMGVGLAVFVMALMSVAIIREASIGHAASSPAVPKATPTPRDTPVPPPPTPTPPPATLSASSFVPVPAGRLVLAGTGFVPGETISFLWDGTRLDATATADSSGAFSGATVVVPANAAAGAHQVTARGISSGRRAALSITLPSALVRANPLTAMPGQQVSIQGSGFGAGESISLSFASKVLASPQADDQGAFGVAVEIPLNAEGGSRAIVATGATTQRRSQVTITVVGSTTPGPSPTVPITSTPLAGRATLSVSATIITGTMVTLAGSGFAAGETILLSEDGTPLNTAITADGTGAFSNTVLTLPNTIASGSHLLAVRGQTSSRHASVTITVPTAVITIKPLESRPGQPVSINGSGFESGEVVSFYWGGAKLLSSTQADAQGAFTGTLIIVPVEALSGSRGLVAQGKESQRRAQARITVGEALPTSTPTSLPGPPQPPAQAGAYHFSGSLIATPGAQVSHIDGILTVRVTRTGLLTGSRLRLTTGDLVSLTGSGTHGLRFSFGVGNLPLMTGQSTAVGANRITGLFTTNMGSTSGFWVATRIAAENVAVQYGFSGKIDSGPDAKTNYSGLLTLWSDSYGGLAGTLTLSTGDVLQVAGQSVNGDVNMLIIVRSGTPLFASGTMRPDGSFKGTIAGPLAGDRGTWAASR